jgi:secondary thiamine-phosphate synthase enzyme
MKVHFEELGIQSTKEMQIINITEEVERVVDNSGIQNGVVNVITMHTTTGITVNEGISCLEEDIIDTLERLAPEGLDYHHARYLDFDGRLGVNAHCHLRSMITGMNTMFPVKDGKVIRGGRQNVYFVETDGPLYRKYVVQVLGE